MLKFLFTALVFVALFPFAGKAQGKVTVLVSNLKTNAGVMRICLFDNADAFGGSGKPVQCMAAVINNKNTVATFENVPPGIYAISVFHDVNKNNKLDVNFLGIPKEGYGASQNRLPFASAPTFNDNRFNLSAGGHLQLPIRLRHL